MFITANRFVKHWFSFHLSFLHEGFLDCVIVVGGFTIVGGHNY